jgi:hypothetical protein
MTEAGDATGMVYSWWVWLDVNGAAMERSPRWMIEGNAFEKLLQVNYTGNASVPLFRRRSVEEVGGYNEILASTGAGGCEDWDVALKVAERYRVAVVPELLVGYRRRAGSMSSACETMWLSRLRVTEAMSRLRPRMKRSILRRSSSQFALYLSAVSFSSGEYAQAVRWGLRASSSELPFLILPYLARMAAKQLIPRPSVHPQFMQPGVTLDTSRIPGPRIPYDRFY